MFVGKYFDRISLGGKGTHFKQMDMGRVVKRGNCLTWTGGRVEEVCVS